MPSRPPLLKLLYDNALRSHMNRSLSLVNGVGMVLVSNGAV